MLVAVVVVDGDGDSQGSGRKRNFFNLNPSTLIAFFCALSPRKQQQQQVIAAPYQDRNCFAIARELEAAFGGWNL